MLGQTFVYPYKILLVNELRVHSRRQYGPENPSESLVESGLRHSGGKTFRAGEEDGFRAVQNLRLRPVCGARERWGN